MTDNRSVSAVEEEPINVSHEIRLEPSRFSSKFPLTCRWPARGAPKGFVFFCHGLGASGRDYADLSSHWARNGFLVIHPTFRDWINCVAEAEPGLGLDPHGDNTAWTANPLVRARMHEILHTPSNWLERLTVVREVMDGMDSIMAATCGTQVGALPGAIAGHSFGAYTTQLLAGAIIDMPGQPNASFRDSRFRAAVVLSGQGRDQQGLRDGSWDHIDGPLLNVTGTLDQGAKGGDWHWKCEPYDFAPPGGKYLAVLEDADHYLGGMSSGGHRVSIPAQREAVKRLTLAFLDAHVVDEPSAAAWLGSITDRVGDCPLLFRRK